MMFRVASRFSRAATALSLAAGLCAVPGAARAPQPAALPLPDEGVLFQQFTYPTDDPPAGVSWWRFAAGQLPELARLGVSTIWAPVPIKGGSGARSMGYDPYDYYDLGAKNQKGTVATRFGTKEDYLRYVAMAHANGLKVYADVVLNHSGGADQAEENPLMARLGMDDIPDESKVPKEYLPPGYRSGGGAAKVRSWTRYRPVGANGVPGTGRFARDWRHFHPSAVHPDRNGPYHSKEFGEDICFEADNGYAAKHLSDWGAWLRAQTGVDGFRVDAVKHIEPGFLDTFAARARLSAPGPFSLVAEYWDTNHDLLEEYQAATRHQMSLFDFGLFYALWDMTEKPGEFNMNVLLTKRLRDRSRATMFVSNHDVDRAQPIHRRKRRLAYAITMTMAGRPSVFYRDYFGAEDPALPRVLPALVSVHNRFARGAEIVRFVDADVLVLERGAGNLLAAFNDGGKSGRARTLSVATGFGPNVRLQSAGVAPGESQTFMTNAAGRVTFSVPPGGYVLLARGADASARTPDRSATHGGGAALSTTQTTEFADDLDTGRLGNAWREVPVTLAAGSGFVARLTGTARGSGGGRNESPVLMELRGDASGRIVAQARGVRGRTTVLRLRRVPAGGRYRLRLRAAPGPPTNGRVAITYRAPARL